MAELCGVLIGYLKVQAPAADPVFSISIVHDNYLLITRQIIEGYLLIQFSRNKDLSNLGDLLFSIIGEKIVKT